VVSMWRGTVAGQDYYMPSSYGPVWFDGLTRSCNNCAVSARTCWCWGRSRSRTQWCRLLVGHLDDATACSPPRSTAVNSPVSRLSPRDKPAADDTTTSPTCSAPADRCPIIVGNTLVYFDGIHVTIEYARALAPVMGALADRALAGG